MKDYLRIDFNASRIVMDRTYSKRARIVGSDAYNQLQCARRDYPEFTVIIHGITKNPNKETYRGLTYQYMEDYMARYDTDGSARKDYDVLRFRAKCHTIRYPAIKKWFLARFPEVKDLEMKIPAPAEDSTDDKRAA